MTLSISSLLLYQILTLRRSVLPGQSGPEGFLEVYSLGYKHEPFELCVRRCLGARELLDQLHEDGGDGRADRQGQVRLRGPEVGLPAGDSGVEEARAGEGRGVE